MLIPKHQTLGCLEDCGWSQEDIDRFHEYLHALEDLANVVDETMQDPLFDQELEVWKADQYRAIRESLTKVKGVSFD